MSTEQSTVKKDVIPEDLKSLKAEGYSVEIQGNCFVVKNIAYLDTNDTIKIASIVGKLSNEEHTVMFTGETAPYKNRSRQIVATGKQRYGIAIDKDITMGLSARPYENNGKYPDNYVKAKTYIHHISKEAKELFPDAFHKSYLLEEVEIFKAKNQREPTLLEYKEICAQRIRIEDISQKTRHLKISIVGLGGTGSYILDQIAKTNVKEIHLYDNDSYNKENAYRSPGSPSDGTFKNEKSKVSYYKELYQSIHPSIIAHEEKATEETENLYSSDFVFISVDNGEEKRGIVQKLIENKIPFIDTGIGMIKEGDYITGQLSTNLVTPEKSDHIQSYGKIDYGERNEEDIYNNNIQTAEINMINAAFAIIKWKKYYKIYPDLEGERRSFYIIDTNRTINRGGRSE